MDNKMPGKLKCYNCDVLLDKKGDCPKGCHQAGAVCPVCWSDDTCQWNADHYPKLVGIYRCYDCGLDWVPTHKEQADFDNITGEGKVLQ